MELVSMVKAGIRIARSCIAQQRKALETQAKAKRVGRSVPTHRGALSGVVREPTVLWEHGCAIAEQVTVVLEEALADSVFNLGMPNIVRCKTTGEGACALFAPECEIAVEIKTFHDKFRKSAMYSERGRGQRSIPEGMAKELRSFVATCVGEDMLLDGKDFPEAAKALFAEASVFAIAKNSEHFTTEVNYVGAFRFTYVGSRTILCVRLMEVAHVFILRHNK